MNIEDLEKELENFQIFDFEKVENLKRHTVRDKHLTWSSVVFKHLGKIVDREVILTLWNSDDAQHLIVDYNIADKNGKSLGAHNTEFNLAKFAGDWDDLNDDVEAWIDEVDDDEPFEEQIETKRDYDEVAEEEPTELATESKSNYYDEDDREDDLKLDNLYSETDAMVTAKMMNDFGLSFVTTVEDENPDLRRKPPFTADDIAKWFEEAIRIIQKRYDEDVANETNDETEYANGPIYITANKYGIVNLNVNLFSHVGE